jgi:DNA-binding transcriptional LysR family regulator
MPLWIGVIPGLRSLEPLAGNNEPAVPGIDTPDDREEAFLSAKGPPIMININQLRAFYCVAKNMSFTKAAKELFITQPAVTAQVKHFEDWCELKLFKKKGRGICLTDEGEMLYRQASQIFEYEVQIEQTIDDYRQLKKGVLRIGSTRTYARYLMPLIMRQFHKKFSKIQIYLDEGSSMDLSRSLLELKNEIAIISKVRDEPDIVYILFSEEEVLPILNPDHRLAKNRYLTMAQLAKEPIVMRENGSGTRKLVDDLFEQHGLKPNILMETANTEFIKQLVARGDGISFLVREAVSENLQNKILATVPLQYGNRHLDVNFAYLKNQPLSLPAQAFLGVFNEMVPGKRPIQGIRSLFQAKQVSDQE